MLLVCTASFQDTGYVPTGVPWPARPCVMGTGPYSTPLSFSSHARFWERLTQARIPGPQGAVGVTTGWGSGVGVDGVTTVLDCVAGATGGGTDNGCCG